MDIMELAPEKRLVHTAQTYLGKKGYYTLKLDGDYGPATSDAVIRFKRVHGFFDRDYLGPKTMAKLVSDKAIPWDDWAPPLVSKEDVSGLPPMLAEAVRHLGVREIPGSKSEPVIMGWAQELKEEGALDWYTGDEIPWCGLFHAILALRCHKELEFPPNVLSARNWGGRDVPRGVNKSAADEPGWGSQGPNPQDSASVSLGSTGIMWRTSKTESWHGHIGIIDAQNSTHIRMIGGNQANSVSRSWYHRSKFLGTRRVPSVEYVNAPTLPTGSTGAAMI